MSATVPTYEAALATVRAQAPAASARAAELLAQMYSATALQGADRAIEVAQTNISVAEGALLHQLARAVGARRSLEIGFALGFSTIWLLDALPAGGTHVAVDPFERTQWDSVGLQQVGQLGASAAFEWREVMGIHALSDAIRAGERYELVFIDGNHRFDDVIVDFYLADQVLRPGGAMVLHDMWMPSIRTVASFIASNRAYSVIEQPEPMIAAFQKTGDDSRDWRHFVPFAMHGLNAAA